MHRWPLALLSLQVLAPAQQDPFGGSAWLRDPRFRGEPVIAIDRGPLPQGKKAHHTRLRNVHTLLRRVVELREAPRKATLWITGDDYYKLWIGGRFVVQGPEPGYPFAHPYFELDVTDRLRKGANCLAAHCYYHGLYARSYNSADNRSGFMLALEVSYADGESQRFVTDSEWRCSQLDAISSDRVFGYDTQFNENIDMRRMPAGWRKAAFDAAGWERPLTGRQDHVFVKQITPPLAHRRADPVRVVQVDGARWFFDFGRELVGHPRVRARGAAGSVITVRQGEELAGKDRVRFDMRCNCRYEDRVTLSGRGETVEFYDYRAFRYMEVLGAAARPEVWVDVRHHPFDRSLSRFTSSDELLERIFELAKNGIEMGCQSVIVDCPTREKGQYLGDAWLTVLSQLPLTADPLVAKKVLDDFRRSQEIDPGIMAVAPGTFRQEIAEYSLMWPLLLRYYWRMTGDRTFTERMAVGLAPLFRWFRALEDEHGLLTRVNAEKWVLVDWPRNLRGGYDYAYAKDRANTVVNAFYYAALGAAADVAAAIGGDPAAYRARAARVKTAFGSRLLDRATGLFRDAPGSSHSSLHANALPLAFGLVAPEHVPAVLALIREQRLNCGIFNAAYVIDACFAGGDPALGYDLLTSRDERSWHEMLKAGATTPLEAWGPDQKWNTSWCHPAGSTPVWLLVTRVLGLTPAEPGWRAIRFDPKLPARVTDVDLTFPIPQGPVRVQRRAGKWSLEVPDGVRVIRGRRDAGPGGR